MTRPLVILASASPRRRELLNLIGIEHEVRPANIDETYLAGEAPREHAERLAREKAVAIEAPEAITIGSDTIVVVDGRVLGKPRDREHAAEMLRQLSGRSHVVMTGVAAKWQGTLVSGLEEVGVTFRSLREDEIERYIDTGEPMDKAGAYAVQGIGAMFIDSIHGSYTNVVGLPLALLFQMLRRAGIDPLRLDATR